ncbi:MAG: hypothetical protein ABI894_11185 [Ilumatobacteraceae bacterium]
MTQQLTVTASPPAPTPAQLVVECTRNLTLAGIPIGVLVIGVGSRLAMLILRVTSPDRVNGVTSDDGFVIGQVTLGGSYNLLHIGAAVGLIGAGAYRLVSPWLIGPAWIRRFTTGAAAAAVAGSILLHGDGVDFTLLKPTWLAIGLFIALPGLFGVAISIAVDRVARSTWVAEGRRRWLVPIALVVAFPVTLLFVVLAALVVTVCVGVQRIAAVQRVRTSMPYGLAVRAVWLAVALGGLLALVHDVQDIV